MKYPHVSKTLANTISCSLLAIAISAMTGLPVLYFLGGQSRSANIACGFIDCIIGTACVALCTSIVCWKKRMKTKKYPSYFRYLATSEE